MNILYKLNGEIADFPRDLESGSLLEKSLDSLARLMNTHSGVIFLEDSEEFSAQGFKNVDEAAFKDFKILQGDDLLKIINEVKQPIAITELGKNSIYPIQSIMR